MLLHVTCHMTDLLPCDVIFGLKIVIEIIEEKRVFFLIFL